MEYRPYKLLNATELAEIGKRIEAACNIWVSAWLTGHVECEVNCYRAAEFDRASLVEQRNWMRVDDAGQWLAVACSPTFIGRLGSALIQSGQSDGVSVSIGGKASALLSELVKRAVADFLLQICGSSSTVVKMQDAEMPDAQTWEAGSGAAVADIVWGSEKLTLVISTERVASMLAVVPSKPARKAQLTKPVDALANGRLKFNVLVGEAQLELALLQTIGVGDVIRLDTRIDEPLQVVNTDGNRVCGAFLGCSDGRKSIQLTK